MIKKIKQLFCIHEYDEIVTREYERLWDDRHVYDICFYKCKKCGHEFKIRKLVDIEFRYYNNSEK